MTRAGAQNPAPPFARFAEHFFATFGQATQWEGERLHVTLDGELAGWFGQEALVLAFTPHDPEGELVAYGSRLFDDMVGFLAGRGRWAAGRLAARHAPPGPPPLVNGTVEAVAPPAAAPRHGHLFHFQLAFVCDERVERLWSVCLDAAGRPDPALAARWHAAAGGEPVEADAPERALVEAAERLAAREAETWALPMEEAALERLRGLGEVLVGYYEQQMREVPIRRRRGLSEEAAIAEADETRWALRVELERKLRDETARHQLRIQVRRLAQAVVVVPGHTLGWRLASPHAARALSVWHDAHTGETTWPACERCEAVPAAYALCAHGHLTCPACMGGCAACARDVCRAELRPCEACGAEACGGCLATCPAGHRTCASHAGACPTCGQVVCPVCGPHAGCGGRMGSPPGPA